LRNPRLKGKQVFAWFPIKVIINGWGSNGNVDRDYPNGA
jgi:hypothetical protein